MIPALMITCSMLLYILQIHFYPPEQFIFSDAKIYFDTALAIQNNKWGLWSFFQSGFYSWCIAQLLKIYNGSFGAIYIVNILLMALGLFCFWKASQKVLGDAWGRFALFLGCAHLHWYSLSSFLMPDLWYTAGHLILFYLLVILFQKENPKNSALLGVGVYIGFLSLIKSTHLLYPGVLFLISLKHLPIKKNILQTGLITAGILLPLLAQGLWSQSKVHQFIPLSLNSGLNLVEGKCPSKVNYDSKGAGFQSPLFNQLGDFKTAYWSAPFTDITYFRNQGLQCIQEDPMVLLTSFKYIYYLFAGNHLWPANILHTKKWTQRFDFFFILFYIPLILLGLFYLWRAPLSLQAPLLPVMSLLIAVYIFKSELRYRVPYDGYFIVISVYALRTFAKEKLRVYTE